MMNERKICTKKWSDQDTSTRVSFWFKSVVCFVFLMPLSSFHSMQCHEKCFLSFSFLSSSYSFVTSRLSFPSFLSCVPRLSTCLSTTFPSSFLSAFPLASSPSSYLPHFPPSSFSFKISLTHF